VQKKKRIRAGSELKGSQEKGQKNCLKEWPKKKGGKWGGGKDWKGWAGKPWGGKMWSRCLNVRVKARGLKGKKKQNRKWVSGARNREEETLCQ